MEYAVRKHTYGGLQWDTYKKIMTYFSKQFFKSDDIKVGDGFFHKIGKYLDKTKYPCDRLVLCCFTGYSNVFGIKFKYKNEDVSWVDFEVKEHGIILIRNMSYSKKDFSIFHYIIEEFFDKYNQKIMEKWLKLCNITDNNSIEIEHYTDYKVTDISVMNGTLSEIFERYTTINDRYKYCNGHYVKFKDKNISTLYSLFVTCYKGNYFLDNAVKRGVLID